MPLGFQKRARPECAPLNEKSPVVEVGSDNLVEELGF